MAKVLSNLRITQHYGNNGHTGVDLGATSDRKVYANSSGTVEQIQTGYGNNQGSTGMASYGNMVLIKHPNGMKTRYAHLQSVNVSKGQYVSAGQQIGVQGNTGNSYGTHLHYEVYNSAGSRINPEPYIETPVYKVNTSGITGDLDYQVYDNVRKAWCPQVTNDKDYAGNKGHAIGGLRVKSKYATIGVESRVNGKWLSKITSNNYVLNSNDGNTYSGIIGKNIDAIIITCDKGYVKYRVGLVDGTVCGWVDSRNASKTNSNGYAGIFGKPISWIQMK